MPNSILASNAGDGSHPPLLNIIPNMSWQAPPRFASGSPFAWFSTISPDSKQPFAPRPFLTGAQVPTVGNVVNVAHSTIASGPAFSPFREFAL